MAVYRFKITFEDHEETHIEIDIKSTQTLQDFHYCILKSIKFDTIHNASFFISDDYWRKGREIILREEEQTKTSKNKKQAETLMLMSNCKLVSVIDDPHQRFVYNYDTKVVWTLLIELMKIMPDNPKIEYPSCFKNNGQLPPQYLATTLTTGAVNEEDQDLFDDDEIEDDDEAYDSATSEEDATLLEGEEGEMDSSDEELANSEEEEDFGASEFEDNEHSDEN